MSDETSDKEAGGSLSLSWELTLPGTFMDHAQINEHVRHKILAAFEDDQRVGVVGEVKMTITDFASWSKTLDTTPEGNG